MNWGLKTLSSCLNPCFSGTYSRSQVVQLESGFFKVLILVLVEHTLGDDSKSGVGDYINRLNPCFSGTYSRRALTWHRILEKDVLILVLVEHTLGDIVL